jgi:hypothetical protein
MINDDLWKAGQRLTREWKRGKLTMEQFQIESLKLSVQMKERVYLRCASHLIEARKLLEEAEERLRYGGERAATADKIHTFLDELEADR